MKKKILFVIPNLGAGGAEKSLVNLLNELDYNLYEVDLLLFSKTGLFFNQLPKEVNLVDLNSDYITFQNSLPQSIYQFLIKGKFRLALYRFFFYFTNRILKNKAVAEQRSWMFIKESFTTLDKKYDVSIAYLEKSSIYFVVDFVRAQHKIAYIHNDYHQLGLDFNFDKKYFQKIDDLVTVSEKCKNVLERIVPEKRVHLIHNITSIRLLHQLANEFEVQKEEGKVSILTIARLADQKGIDLAIQAAKILIEHHLDFVWNVIGEGIERKNLEKAIKENRLEGHFKLLGLRENPYPYLKSCDFYVQPSRYEGKSIAIDEALLLKKLIIVTRFSTAEDQITDQVNGWIAEMNPGSLADKLLDIYHGQDAQNKVVDYLNHQVFDFKDELIAFNLLIQKY